MDDTIYARATAPGRAGVTIWRVSGPDSATLISRLTGRALPPPRNLVLRVLRHPTTSDILDRAMLVWFPGPSSYTGEDCVELHTHGGRAVAAAIEAALGALPGFRAADPGEFTKRAFLNGKVDLTEAEAIADLAAAETEMQRRQAVSQAGGSLQALYENWRTQLVTLRARLEAAIEFPEDDLGDLESALSGQIVSLRDQILQFLRDARRGERLRDGVTVAVVGVPNAGKSSLVNWIAQRDVAIVSELPGTTRDLIEVNLDLGGYPVVLVDTAGLRDAENVVEQEGIERARRRAASADIKLVLFPGNEPPHPESIALADGNAIVVLTKADLTGDRPEGPNDPRVNWGDAVRISTVTGSGMDELLSCLRQRVEAVIGSVDTPIPTRERHRHLLEACSDALSAGLVAPLPELVADDLRVAGDMLGRITGRIDVEEMLDSVFRDFCIGK